MTAPRYTSAWGEPEEPEPAERVDNIPENVARGAEVIRGASGAEPSPTGLAGSTPAGNSGFESPAGTTFSAALAQALVSIGPPRTSWGVLAHRLGLHTSVLRRLRLGQGVSSQTMDKVAQVLGWTVTITPRS